jgi:hypothetical protein
MEALRPEDIPGIIADRGRYERLLYTPLPEAYAELERRRQDANLQREISAFLKDDIPEPLLTKPKAVLTRNVMSPNYEVRRFADLVEGFGKLEPLYWEYPADKFTSNNELKHRLGRLCFFNGKGKRGGKKIDPLNIIDLVAADGEPISSVRTLWGQNFVRFHHEFFDARHRKLSHTFYDSSPWLTSHGKNAEAYYQALLALFVRHGILFENVMLNAQELPFAARIFLPTFISVYRRFGFKPLIVPLVPTEDEEDRMWMCYPGDDMPYVEANIR